MDDVGPSTPDKGYSPSSSSLLSALLCRESGAHCLGEERGGELGDEADQFVSSLMSCCSSGRRVSDSEEEEGEEEEEEYVRILLETEKKNKRKKIDDGGGGGGGGGGGSVSAEEPAAKEASPTGNAGDWRKLARVDSVDYILNARSVLRFQFQTAYLAVTYLDRFLSRRTLESDQSWAMKLLSVACLSLAAKFEEPYVPHLLDFQLGEKVNFEGKVVQRMELLILNVLEWKISSVTPFAYLPFFIGKLYGGCPSRAVLMRILQLIIEVMKDPNLMDYSPSAIALSSVLITLDPSLSRAALSSKIHLIIPCSGSLDLEDISSCYIIMQRLDTSIMNARPKLLAATPDLSPINLRQIDAFQNPQSTSSICSKRKRLEFDQDHGLGDKRHPDSEN